MPLKQSNFWKRVLEGWLDVGKRLVRSKDARNYLLLAFQFGSNAVLGYVFLKVLALKYGTTADKDSFDIAYTFPFLVLNLTGISFLNSIVASKFSGMLSNDAIDINRLFSTCLNVIAIMALLGIALVWLSADSLVLILAPGLDAANRSQVAFLIIVMSPLVFTLGVGAYLSGVLVAHGMPIAGPFCALFSRLGAIGWAWGVGFNYDLRQISFALVAFSLLGLGIQWALVCKFTRLRALPLLEWKDHAFLGLAKQGLGMAVASILASVGHAYMRRLATIDGEGTTAAITYSLTLVSAIALLIGKPLFATAGLRHLRQWELGDSGNAKRTIVSALLMSAICGIGITLALNIYSVEIIRLLYGGGRFDEGSIAATAQLLRIFSASLAPVIMLYVALAPLLNLKWSHAPAFVYCMGYIVHIILSYLLFHWLGRDGLAWAYTMGIFTIFLAGLSLVWARVVAVSQ